MCVCVSLSLCIILSSVHHTYIYLYVYITYVSICMCFCVCLCIYMVFSQPCARGTHPHGACRAKKDVSIGAHIAFSQLYLTLPMGEGRAEKDVSIRPHFGLRPTQIWARLALKLDGPAHKFLEVSALIYFP